MRDVRKNPKNTPLQVKRAPRPTAPKRARPTAGAVDPPDRRPEIDRLLGLLGEQLEACDPAARGRARLKLRALAEPPGAIQLEHPWPPYLREIALAAGACQCAADADPNDEIASLAADMANDLVELADRRDVAILKKSRDAVRTERRKPLSDEAAIHLTPARQEQRGQAEWLQSIAEGLSKGPLAEKYVAVSSAAEYFEQRQGIALKMAEVLVGAFAARRYGREWPITRELRHAGGIVPIMDLACASVNPKYEAVLKKARAAVEETFGQVGPTADPADVGRRLVDAVYKALGGERDIFGATDSAERAEAKARAAKVARIAASKPELTGRLHEKK
jgi:hypothetical protein